MAEHSSNTISHFGICVSDLDRSIDFYTKALGFEYSHDVSFGAPFEILTELPEIEATAVFLVHSQVMIELIGYKAPESVGPMERRPMNQIGLTHVAIVVDDLESTSKSIENFGGHVHSHTKVSTPKGNMMFCTDPDGVRLEVWEKTS